MKLTAEQINQLINELIAFEPAWQGRESELIEMVTNLVETKPEIIFDETFRMRLREEVMQFARERSASGTRSNFIFNFNHMINLKKISYGLAGAAILILLIFPAIFLLLGSKNRFALLTKTGKKIAVETKINRISANAFGDLRGGIKGKTAPMTAQLEGGGGGVETAGSGSASGIVQPLGMGGGGSVPASDSAKLGIMPPYEFRNYRFIYKGADLSTPTEKMDVLKLIKGAQVRVKMNDLVQGLNFGLSDLGTFFDLSLQNISLTEKGDNGYIINIMPEEGSISINQNWSTWPQGKCGNNARCIENQRIKLEDIPSDSELIGITDAFLAEHNIDKNVYGSPEVSPVYDFRAMYGATADKANFYFPESIDVIYPIKVDGKFVYDEWNGTKLGMTVSVQVKQKKVSNLYNLTTQNYQASAYDMETDAKKILAYAEQGGMNSVQYGEETKTEELMLDYPELVYIKYYGSKDGVGEELLVPALYFPISELSKDANFYRKGVVVPLAKSVLEERQAQVVMPYGLGGNTPADSVEAVPSKAAPLAEPKQ